MEGDEASTSELPRGQQLVKTGWTIGMDHDALFVCRWLSPSANPFAMEFDPWAEPLKQRYGGLSGQTS